MTIMFNFRFYSTVPEFTPSISSIVETTYTGLTFSWNQIPCESIGGTGFYYRYRLNTEIGTTQSTSVTFENLRACTEYQFQVRAVNDVGQGQNSSRYATTRAIGKLSWPQTTVLKVLQLIDYSVLIHNPHGS